MNVLVLCDDRWHPAQTVRLGLQSLSAQGVYFVWLEDARAWSPALMSVFPAVILSKSNNITAADETPWMTPAVEQAFADYVHQGGGLLALHSGTAGYLETPRLRSLLGGVFTRHPEQCPVTATPDAKHPLAQGSEPFTLKDEHYFMEMSTAEVDIFLTTQSSHGSQPGGWTRQEGRGRVGVLTPGHNLEVWQHPSYQTLITNTLRWVAQAA